jgi:antibiotic biosynthesis monooxygenase (ABM) superfamily enzyme
MISLHVYLTPAAGKEAELDSAISDAWMTAMADQPGFISGAVLKPFSDDALAALQASVPEYAIEVVAFWTSEEERLAWVARPIHDEVFEKVLAAAEGVSFTLQTAPDSWNIE